MKKWALIALATTLLNNNAHALLQGRDLSHADPMELTLFITTSLPTLFIAGEEVDYSSPAGKALLIQEAQNVLEGKKSLVLKDDEAQKENGLTATQKAQAILDGLNEN